MNERDFIYWLSGFLESSNLTSLNENQVKTIKDHLDLVVKKVTPFNYGITVTSDNIQPIQVNPAFSPSKTEIIC
jgi:hypothetical protein